MTLNQIKAALPISGLDPNDFAAPAGWGQQMIAAPGKRQGRGTLKWVREAHSSVSAPPGGVVNSVHGREELERLLEVEARGLGRKWLGQMVDGQWQIRRRVVDDAIESVLASLVACGAVRVMPGELFQGKGAHQPLYCICNRYVKGEPFPRVYQSRKSNKEEAEEAEEELCDFELERKRNIERNKELLRQLGLA